MPLNNLLRPVARLEESCPRCEQSQLEVEMMRIKLDNMKGILLNVALVVARKARDREAIERIEEALRG